MGEWELKNNRKIQTTNTYSGRSRLREVSAIMIWLEEILYLGKVVAKERWSHVKVWLNHYNGQSPFGWGKPQINKSITINYDKHFWDVGISVSDPTTNGKNYPLQNILLSREVWIKLLIQGNEDLKKCEYLLKWSTS